MEVGCALHRHLRQGSLGAAEVRALSAAFLEHVDGGFWTLIPISERLLRRVASAVSAAPASVFLRAGDALHLIAAQDMGEREIWTSDRHMLAAAGHFGAYRPLRVRPTAKLSASGRPTFRRRAASIPLERVDLRCANFALRILMATFFFRAVAADGRIRTGSLTGDNEKFVARELRTQGLTPVYVGRGAQRRLLRDQAAVIRRGQAARRPLFHPGALHPAQRRRAARPRSQPSPPS